MNSEQKKISLQILSDHTAVPNTLLDHYVDLGLTEKDVIFLVILLRIKGKEANLTFRNVEKGSPYSQEDIRNMVPPLIDKGFLSLSNDGYLLLDGLIEKIFEMLSWNAVKAEQKVNKKRKNAKENKAFSVLYNNFEQEMGRPLSPIEGEQITYWFESQKIPAELIQEGLKRAVLLGKYNFRYIEAILMSWRKEGIQNLEDLKKADEKKKAKSQGTRNGKEPSNERSFRGEQEDIFSDEIYEVF